MTDSIEISPVENRKWWPTEYLDEIMPEGRITPSAWLYRLDDGAVRYGERKDDDWPTWPIVEGETVSFVACDTLGTARLTFEDDGTARWTPRPPDDAYLNEVGDCEMGGDGPDDFVRNLLSFNQPEPGEEFDVNVWRWSNEVHCRFTTEGGEPRFVALAPLPDAPGEPLAPPERTQTEMFGAAG